MITWRNETQHDRSTVVFQGVVTDPIDGGDEPVPFEASFERRMLPGIANYFCAYQPWDLWVTADGQFERDGGLCRIESLRFGWCASDSFRQESVEIIALVRHCHHLDVTANEPQPLVEFVGAEIEVLREHIAMLRTSSRSPRSI